MVVFELDLQDYPLKKCKLIWQMSKGHEQSQKMDLQQ
jgi:hypothetical protein